jgi:hypothetical protein
LATIIRAAVGFRAVAWTAAWTAAWATIRVGTTAARATAIRSLGLILILTAARFHHFGAHVIAFFLVQLPGANEIGTIRAQRFNAAR